MIPLKNFTNKHLTGRICTRKKIPHEGPVCIVKTINVGNELNI